MNMIDTALEQRQIQALGIRFSVCLEDGRCFAAATFNHFSNLASIHPYPPSAIKMLECSRPAESRQEIAEHFYHPWRPSWP
ncbi:hypothetical protein [Phytopseudomonas daroniae]|uniref:hypothetical protein n=1 Tax=Pseudomonadaceae TaxID=135621 RepID=UPI00103727CD|nr:MULTISPECIES: hypothetical protein [Pseudomonas]